MKYLVAFYSIIGALLYVGMLQFAKSMAGFGDGAPHYFNIWALTNLFPFAYFLFTFVSCFIKRPGDVAIKIAITINAVMGICLLWMVFSGIAIFAVFFLGLFGFWVLMFLEKCGVIQLKAKDAFVGIGIVLLILITIALIILSVIYINMNLGSESVLFLGGALGSGLVAYLLLMRFLEKTYIGRDVASLAKAVEPE